MNNEKECLYIENTALNHPELSDILIPIFSPSNTSINTFTQAYKIIVNHCNALYEPIVLQLLSKVSLTSDNMNIMIMQFFFFYSLIYLFVYQPSNLYFQKDQY